MRRTHLGIVMVFAISALALAASALLTPASRGEPLLLFALLLGTGIVPSGAIGAELNAVTRRAFVSKNIVQIYKATPTLAAALANAQPASGGVSSVTVPVQGAPFVNTQATDYSGAFTQPAVQQGITEADYNLKALVVPIPFLGMEGIVQHNAAVIPLLEARMNDAGNSIAAYLSTQLFTNATNGTINPDGLPLIAATTGTYGNIPRAANSWWQGKTRTSSGTSPTRITVTQDILAATKAAGGEYPNIGVMGPGTWSKLAADFLGVENYRVTPGQAFSREANGEEAGFVALSVGSVPIYQDLDCPEGSLFLFNTRYTSYYIHEAAAFAFTGFASTLPNMQLGYIGALVVVLEFVSVKPATVALITGYTAFDVL